ncbi:hypothetical protein M8J75_011502 [Diaphorina citri]|nr:hypothetical protein M8J75_011502 [Diaphorina citri]
MLIACLVQSDKATEFLFLVNVGYSCAKFARENNSQYSQSQEIMKFVAFVVFSVTLAVIASVSAYPAKGGSNSQINKKKNTPPPKCIEICTTNYEPVCAHDENVKSDITFGNECVMRKYNCENAKTFRIKKDGECGGTAPVRLA